MNLYLIRHADALPLGTTGIETDEDRPLSDDGCGQCRALAGMLARLGVRFDKVATSPLVRARQTAETLLPLTGRSDSALVECLPLAPGGSSKKLARFLEHLDGEHIALVGHQPDLSEHAAWFIGSKKARIDFAKGAIACIVCEGAPDKGAGTLQWLVTPEWCGAPSES